MKTLRNRGGHSHLHLNVGTRARKRREGHEKARYIYMYILICDRHWQENQITISVAAFSVRFACFLYIWGCVFPSCVSCVSCAFPLVGVKRHVSLFCACKINYSSSGMLEKEKPRILGFALELNNQNGVNCLLLIYGREKENFFSRIACLELQTKKNGAQCLR